MNKKSPATIADVLARARTIPCVKLHRGATTEEIRSALGTLRVKFPKSYVTFLQECGYADLCGDVVMGLGPDASDIESVRRNTVEASVMGQPRLRPELIPLMADGMGGYECLDTSKLKDGECPVVEWDHEDPKGSQQRCARVAPNFAVWLNRKLDEMPNV